MFDNIGVIGAGTMGTGIAVDLALRDIQVILVDTSAKQLENAQAEIKKTVRFIPLVKKDLPKVSVTKAMDKIHFTTDIQEVHISQFVVENVTEKLEIKEKLYRDLDKICPPEICFGVNTSCISITQIAAVTNRPDKILGMHFMNPVYLKSVIEVMQGYHTSDETIEKAKTLLSQLGKEAIIVNDYPGFVSNRLSHLLMNEAMFVVQDQVATAKQVDDIFKKCFGHKMGPLETADLIGLDVVMDSLDVLYKSYNDPKFRCCPLLRKMVYAGLLGRKSGKGFHNYPT